MTSTATSSSIPTTYDIGPILEQGRWSGYQKSVIGMIALAIILDGFDNQVLGFAIPVLIKEWGLTRADFVPIFAFGFLGMALGTMIGGWLGDRFGRRPALIGSVLVFGLATGSIAFSGNLVELGILRVIAGLGLGGAMPCATTLLSEFAPARYRSLAVTLGIVCIPLGGVVGGTIAARILPTMGWQALFGIGGLMPLVVALLLLLLLPESPRFLVARQGRQGELGRVMRRLDKTIGVDGAFVDTHEVQVERAAIGSLFRTPYTFDTFALWAAFFACLLSTYIVFSWMPTLLSESGFDIAIASSGLALFNMGGVLGSLAGAAAISKVGSKVSMLIMAGGAIIGAIVLALLPLGGVDRSHVLIALAVEGAFINGVQTTLYALAAQMYPAPMRATGVGGAAGFGRLGAIASSVVGAWVLIGGAPTYFGSIAACMAITFVALALIGRHVHPGRARVEE